MRWDIVNCWHHSEVAVWLKFMGFRETETQWCENKKKKKIGKLSGTSVMCFIVCVPVHLNKKPQLHYAKLHHFKQLVKLRFPTVLLLNSYAQIIQKFVFKTLYTSTLFTTFSTCTSHIYYETSHGTHIPQTQICNVPNKQLGNNPRFPFVEIVNQVYLDIYFL